MSAGLPKPEPSAAAVAGSGRWQFGLKDLFGLMTYAAVASALVAWFGPGTLMTSLGMLIAILNVRGVFARWQQGRSQMVLLNVAWSLFLVSLLLPCVSSHGIQGWAAAWAYLVGPFEQLWSESGSAIPIAGWCWLVGIDLSNVLMMCLPFYAWRRRPEAGQWFAAIVPVAMIAVWSTNWSMGFYVGYFVWCASFHVVLLVTPLRWNTFLAMLAYGILLALLQRWQSLFLW